MALLGPDGHPHPGMQHVKEPEPQAPPVVETSTAFLAMQLPSGRWVITDVLDTVVVSERKPTSDDLIAGAANIQAEITARKAADMAAATTIRTQLSMARQAAQQQTSAAEAEAIAAIQVPPAYRGK